MALMFLTEKRDKRVKGRMVYNGKPTREWLLRKDAASPTAALETREHHDYRSHRSERRERRDDI
jgi:hypothetical protein